LPKNARFIGGTSVWTCDKGYQKQSNSCIKVHLPENAHFAFGSSWQCDAGFKRAGGECLAMNQQELVNQVKSLNRMLMMQISESAGGNGNCSTGFSYC
ncbi:hypothetical protein, partial [Vibrio sp. 10N.222.49.C9]|uniref:hypothetical protein n=1 Tax=Vibrio sp. 10N.222.49.C9 TaxID=3229615 RepID=UPI00354F91A4